MSEESRRASPVTRDDLLLQRIDLFGRGYPACISWTYHLVWPRFAFAIRHNKYVRF